MPVLVYSSACEKLGGLVVEVEVEVVGKALNENGI